MRQVVGNRYALGHNDVDGLAFGLCPDQPMAPHVLDPADRDRNALAPGQNGVFGPNADLGSSSQRASADFFSTWVSSMLALLPTPSNSSQTSPTRMRNTVTAW